jgi:hypothetical protein
LVDDIDTMPGGWDLSSLPALIPAGEISTSPVTPLEMPDKSTFQPRLLWLVDPFIDDFASPCYPYFAPF